MWRSRFIPASGQGRRRTGVWKKWNREGNGMQAGWADSRNRVRDSRNYAEDKPGDCKHCYFWKGKRKGCSQKECYYLLPEEKKSSSNISGNLLPQEFSKNDGTNCHSCPYGRHSPCIGYCIQKILREMREKKQSAGKEGECLAGRGK